MRVGNFAQIRPLDVANGPGIRVSIFVAGCTHNCPGCFNQEYMDFNYGDPWTEAQTQQVIEALSNPVIAGLTLLGGEPMQNLWLRCVLKEIKRQVDKPIWIYSGYTFEQIITHRGRAQLLRECDVLVDGLFRQELLDLRLKFRGSSNQRIIDIPSSLAAGQVVLYPLD